MTDEESFPIAIVAGPGNISGIQEAQLAAQIGQLQRMSDNKFWEQTIGIAIKVGAALYMGSGWWFLFFLFFPVTVSAGILLVALVLWLMGQPTIPALIM